MGKGGGSTNVSTTLDPGSQQYVDAMRKMALGYAGGNIPLPPWLQQAQQGYQGYANAGATGTAALTGDPNARAAFMNPYLQTMNPVWDQIRQQSVAAANDQATQAGAFGGSRGDVAQGVALGQVGQQQAAFNADAFNQAMQRALAASQMGLGALGAGAWLPQQYAASNVGLLGAGLGPYGQTTKQQMFNDPWSQLLGTGVTIAGLLG